MFAQCFIDIVASIFIYLHVPTYANYCSNYWSYLRAQLLPSRTLATILIATMQFILQFPKF